MKLLSYDIFGEDVGFTFSNGQRTHGSWIGLLLTVAISGLVILYGMKRWDDVKTGQDTYHSSSERVFEGMKQEIPLSDLNAMYYLAIIAPDESLV
jgi:hypothetical protein